MSIADLIPPNPFPIQAGSVTAVTSLTLPGATPCVLTNSAPDVTVVQTYSGALAQANAGTLQYRRIGNWVNLAFTQSAIAAGATASAVMNLSTTLPAAYRPLINLAIACIVNVNGSSVLGSFSINTSGTMLFNPVTGTFTNGQVAALVTGITASYPVQAGPGPISAAAEEEPAAAPLEVSLKADTKKLAALGLSESEPAQQGPPPASMFPAPLSIVHTPCFCPACNHSRKYGH